jgi:hypothetical protein
MFYYHLILDDPGKVGSDNIAQSLNLWRARITLHSISQDDDERGLDVWFEERPLSGWDCEGVF